MSLPEIVMASDHAGVELRAQLRAELRAAGYAVLDLGPETDASVDYPVYAARLATELARDPSRRGVLICGSGIGMSIAANRFSHIRAALCRDAEDAALARRHNDANALVLGARRITAAAARQCLESFLSTGFDGGRHLRRVAMLARE